MVEPKTLVRGVLGRDRGAACQLRLISLVDQLRDMREREGGDRRRDQRCSFSPSAAMLLLWPNFVRHRAVQRGCSLSRGRFDGHPVKLIPLCSNSTGLMYPIVE